MEIVHKTYECKYALSIRKNVPSGLKGLEMQKKATGGGNAFYPAPLLFEKSLVSEAGLAPTVPSPQVTFGPISVLLQFPSDT